MAQIKRVRCDCCGQEVDLAQTELCPVCQYPVNPEKERHFLETSIRDLQRVARYGGASLRVLDLVRRYEVRLQFLSVLRSSSEQLTTGLPVESTATTISPEAQHLPQAGQEVSVPLLVQHPALARVKTTPGSVAQAAPIVSPPAMPIQPAKSMRGFSLSGDAMVNVLAAVGGFMVLAGVLGTVFVMTNLWLAFLLVLSVHAAFGGASLLTRRSSLLRAVTPLYTIIFSLLVPLVAFSAYRLVEHDLVSLSVPFLLALAALYAAVIYGVLAVVQRFVLFAYLGVVALLVGDLALAQAFHLEFWWWPAVAMLLALLSLIALPRHSGQGWLSERRAILRTPLLVLMYTVMASTGFAVCALLQLSISMDALTQPPLLVSEAHVALFVASCLLVIWFTLWLWLTRQAKYTPLLAYLCLAPFLLLGYTLNLSLSGYVLLETGVALAYHVLVRVASGSFTAVFPTRTLDGLASGLIVLALLQTSVLLPFNLIYSAFAQVPGYGSNISLANLLPGIRFTPESSDTLNLIALGIGLLVTLDISLARAGLSKIPQKASWCWLLVLSGVQLSALYGREVLLWQAGPLWAFLLLSLGTLAGTVLARRLASAAWASPLELLALLEMAFTLLLSLSSSWGVISGLLLAFATLLYVLALAERLPRYTLYTGMLLLLALWSLQDHLMGLLILGLLLPLLVAVLRHGRVFERVRGDWIFLFSWTLLVPAMLSGFWLAVSDMSSDQSVLVSWLSNHWPLIAESARVVNGSQAVAYEMTLLALSWYLAALIARTRLWLILATFFGLLALLQPGDNFWVLSALAPGLALLGAAIEERAQTGWALPFYLLALVGTGMMIFSGLRSEQVQTVTLLLLGYALLAYGIGVMTDHPTAFLFTPLFSTLAVYLAASQGGELYQPPIVTLTSVGLGLLASQIAPRYQRSEMRYALPFYTAALAAALLTGVYGSLGDLNQPFYGAIPDALFLYALLASVVVWRSRLVHWGWLVALFAGWGVLLTQRLTGWYVLSAGVGLVLAGLASEQLIRHTLLVRQPIGPEPRSSISLVRVPWSWSWPWYSASLLAALVLGSWPLMTTQGIIMPIVPGMFIFTVFALLVMLVRREPELLVVPVALAAWSIVLWQLSAGSTRLVVACTLLCVLIYAAQFTWRLWPANTYRSPASFWHHVFSLGGLCVVLLYALSQGALSPTAGWLAQAGVLALVTLSGLLFLYALLGPANAARALPIYTVESLRTLRMESAQAMQHRYLYIVGLLLSLAVSWELLAFGSTRFDTLTLVPASYLIVIAPFLLRDQSLPDRRKTGQCIALLGSALLLLPTLWFSFQGTELWPTLLLLIETLLLLILGLILRLRIFILSSAALIIVGTLRLLFLSMPPSVPILLLAFGGLLMALATTLILSRHRLQAAWSNWE